MLHHTGETVRLSVIGLGLRGYSQLKVLLDMDDVEIVSVCDVHADRVAGAQEAAVKAGKKKPHGTLVTSESIQHRDADAVVIATSWETHVPLAIEALRCGKRVAVEVGGSASVEECWQLVRASEDAKVPVMFLENCCYGETEMALLNMVRQNLFGTVVHCAGGYCHDLRDEVGNGDLTRHYRQNHFLHRNGDLYPTHELGPIANYLKINRGNRMLSLTSMASKACGMHEWLKENRPDSQLADAVFAQGDIVTTMIRCANGETILLTHDCSLPRFYSRGGVIRGTKGLWMEEGHFILIDRNAAPVEFSHKPEPDCEYLQKYSHPLWREYRSFGVRGGHDGMDYLVLRAFIHSIQEQIPPPIDVYDAASWMAVTALSEESIAAGSQPVAIPDFTGGRWCRPYRSDYRLEFEI